MMEDLIYIEEEDDDVVQVIENSKISDLLTELHNGSLSQHRSCWRHLAAHQGRVSKLSEREVIEIKEKFEFVSPCLSHLRHCRKRSRSKKDLLGARWKMSDHEFDNHLENIWRSLSDDDKASCIHLNSLCYLIYKQRKAQGLELIKRKDIFSKKYVFVPIVCWDHWRLLVFCHFGEAANSETRTRCILLLDSAQSCAQIIEPDVRKFVYDIFMAAGRPESKDAIYRIPLLVPQVPQQTNEFDCGRFVLYYIRMFMEAPPEKFSISNGYPYFLKRDWFDYESFVKFCYKLEREIPTKQGRTSKRRSQRIRNSSTFARKNSRQSVEVIFIEG